MDRETRSALARLEEQVQANSARMEAGFARTEAGFARTEAGFARMDHYFELLQAQRRDDLDRIDARFDQVDQRFERVEARLDRVEGEVRSLRAELSSFRDWVTTQFTELRAWLRDLTARVESLEGR